MDYIFNRDGDFDDDWNDKVKVQIEYYDGEFDNDWNDHIKIHIDTNDDLYYKGK